MSLEKIIKEAIDKNPMEMKDAFAEEMQTRIALALEEKYKKAMEAKDSDEDDDDDDADEDDDEDADKDADKDDDDDADEDDKPAFLKKKNEEVEETSDETLEEGPFKGVGKMLMKRKLNKASKSLYKSQVDNGVQRARTSSSLPSEGPAANRRYDKLSDKGDEILAKRHRVDKAKDRLNRKPTKDVKFPFNNR